MGLAIDVSDLVFAWRRGDQPVLQVPALRIDRGERVFVKGPSGSGKTTLLNILGGVVQAQAGAVRIVGTDLTELGAAARDRFRARHIGFIFQQFNLVPYLDLIDNAALPCRFSTPRRKRAEVEGGVRAEASRLLARMGLEEEVSGRRAVATLSVGQQQRVAAARALIGRPDLIVADEPTSALDAAAAAAFLDLVLDEAAASGATVLFVSHDERLQSHFDRTIDLPEINRVTA